MSGGSSPTASGSPLARAVVCALGPWNPTIAATAGLGLPVGYSLAPVPKLDANLSGRTLPIVTHVESGVYDRDHRDGSVLVEHYPRKRDWGLVDPDGVDDRVPEDRRGELLGVVADLPPTLADAPVAVEQVGTRSHTSDGDPIVGWTGIEGLSVIAFNSSGNELSPAAGDVVARQLVRG